MPLVPSMSYIVCIYTCYMPISQENISELKEWLKSLYFGLCATNNDAKNNIKLVMGTSLHTRMGLRVRVSRARVRVSKLLPIGKPAPVTRGCGFGRRSFKKLVIDIFFSVFVVNDNNAATATASLANVSRGGFSFLSTKEV